MYHISVHYHEIDRNPDFYSTDDYDDACQMAEEEWVSGVTKKIFVSEGDIR